MRSLSCVFLAFPGLLAIPVATAVELDPILVTESREAIEADLPVHRSIITAEEIRASTARNLPELLAQQAGISVRSLFGDASRTTVDLRGFGATGTQNTLILLDGRRLNDVDTAAIDFAAIPLNNIERVEILRGAGSVLYGDGAAGGTINIITRRGEDTGLHGNLRAGTGSYDALLGEGRGSLATEHFSANVFAGRTESDNYRDHNKLEQTNGQADLRWLFGDDELYLKLGIDDQHLDLPAGRTVDPGLGLDELEDDRRGTGSPFDFAEQEGKLGTLGWRHSFGEAGELLLDGGVRDKNQQAFLSFGGGFSSFIDTDLRTWSLTPRFVREHGLFGREGSQTLGLDFYYSDYDSDRKRQRSDDPIHSLSARQWSAAAYAQATTEVLPGLDLTSGFRLQHVDLRARDAFDPAAPDGGFGSEATPLSRDDTEYALELGLTQHFTEAFALYSRFTRSLRFATVDELFELDPAFTQVFSALEPQVGETLDLGLEWEQGPWSLTSGVFYGHFRDEIQFDPVSFSNLNLDPTQRYGAELSAGLRPFASLHLQASYTYTRARFDAGPNEGKDVPLVPDHLAALSATWQAREWLSLSAALRHVGSKRFDNDQANDFGRLIPAYTLLDLQAALQWQSWQLRGAVHNVADEEAFDYGAASSFTPGRFNAFPLPERNFTASLEYEF